MKLLLKFLRLAPADRRLLLRALGLLAAVRLGLWLLPFPSFQRLLARLSPGGPRPVGAGSSLERIVWAVVAASRFVPRATCLVQARAAQFLLAREGHPASLRIGVTRADDHRFQAHAWVESKGRIVLGGAAVQEFTPLPSWQGHRR